MISPISPVSAGAVAGAAETYKSGTPPQESSGRTAALPAEKVRAVVEELNRSMQAMGTSLSFSVDAITRKTVIRVMNDQTGEVIRQIPAEDMLRMSQRIAELLGVLYDGAA